MPLKTRNPTGAVPWPVVLLEGGEKAGKSWAAAVLSASPKVGQTYWIDLSEGAADEYGAIPGVRYKVVDHDGSWNDIVDQVQAVREEARRADAAGEPPVVLVIDSMSAEWAALSDWTIDRARRSTNGRKILDKDPNAEVPVSMNLWNDANSRHRRLMAMLLTFPGIVVLTARGKEVAEIDSKGKPVPNSKEYKVEGQKGLAFDVSVWVRMSRNSDPLIVGARSVHTGIKPGADDPQPVRDFSLEWLIFDALRCDPKKAHVRDLREIGVADAEPGTDALSEVRTLLDEAGAATTREQFMPLWERANGSRWMTVEVDGSSVQDLLRQHAERIKQSSTSATETAPAQPTREQHARMHAQLAECGVTEPERHATLGTIIGRPITSANDLTSVEAGSIIELLGRCTGQAEPARALDYYLSNLDAGNEATT